MNLDWKYRIKHLQANEETDVLDSSFIFRTAALNMNNGCIQKFCILPHAVNVSMAIAASMVVSESTAGLGHEANEQLRCSIAPEMPVPHLLCGMSRWQW